MEPTAQDVTEHLETITSDKRRADAEALVAMLTDLTGREPRMWSGGIVGFGACHYRYPTGTQGDSPILGFAPRKAATTLYLLDGVDAHADALSRLGPHTTGKGCLYVKDLAVVDLAVLRDLLTDSYRRTSEGGGYADITVTS